MAKRHPANSITGQITAMENAHKDIKIPSHVSVPDDAYPFWASITRARAAERWTDADLEIAAELARSKANIERLNKEITDEGDVVRNDRGTQIPNPKHNLLETLTRRVVALSRMIQVHAEATQGKSRDQVKTNKAQQTARTTVDNISEDGLIAQPRH